MTFTVEVLSPEFREWIISQWPIELRQTVEKLAAFITSMDPPPNRDRTGFFILFETRPSTEAIFIDSGIRGATKGEGEAGELLVDCKTDPAAWEQLWAWICDELRREMSALDFECFRRNAGNN